MTTFCTGANLDYLDWCQQIGSEFRILASGEQNLSITFNTKLPQLIYTPFDNQNWHNSKKECSIEPSLPPMAEVTTSSEDILEQLHPGP